MPTLNPLHRTPSPGIPTPPPSGIPHPYPVRKGPGTRDTLPLPVNRLTDTYENITFPQLLLRAATS